jgi:predicted nucleic acid-binding protein
VIVVSDASPLITLSKIGRLSLLHDLYEHVVIAAEVHDEVVTKGAGLIGSAEVATAPWINVEPPLDRTKLQSHQSELGLAAGEVSTIMLGQRLNADLLLIDEIKARKAAQSRGLLVIGCVGVLESGYRRALIEDLRREFSVLIKSGAYIHPRVLNQSLRSLNLPEL